MAGLDAARASGGRPPPRRGRSCRRACRSAGRRPRGGPPGPRGPQATGAAGWPPGSELRCAPISARRNSISCSSSIEVEKPGRAGVAPAPLGAGDHRHVHLVVGGPQRDFALAGALAAHDLAHEHRDLRAPQRPQVVDDALGVAFLRRRRPRSRRRSSAISASSPSSIALDPRRARSRAARACRSSCPRTGAGRRRGTSTPASISSAAIPCARAEVFSYMKRPVSVIRPDVQGLGDRRRRRERQPVHQVPHDLGRAGGARGRRG